MERVRSSVIVSAAAVLGFVLLLVGSTGAVVFDGPTDTINNKLGLLLGDNPYAYLDEDGELAGLAALVGIALATLFLVRRAPR